MPDEKLAKAIHSKVRRDILHLFYAKDKISVHETAEKLNITESLASKNLKLLYYFGFLDYEILHPEKFYYLKIKEIRDLFDIYDMIVKKMEGK